MDFQKSISEKDCIIQWWAFLGTGFKHPRQCDLNLKEIKRPLVLSQNHTSKEKASSCPGLWGNCRFWARRWCIVEPTPYRPHPREHSPGSRALVPPLLGLGPPAGPPGPGWGPCGPGLGLCAWSAQCGGWGLQRGGCRGRGIKTPTGIWGPI